MTIYVGTSGYSYKEWKGRFYPERIANDEMLEFYSRHFKTVEINNTFYRMPRDNVVTGWKKRVGDDFRFVLKVSRRITHLKRLKDAGEELLYFLETAMNLGDKLGPLLFQLPPGLKADVERLQLFLDEIPDGWRVAFEFRHPSWNQDEIRRMLEGKRAAWVVADTDGTEPGELPRTAAWGYLRLRRADYSDQDLAAWAARIRCQDWDDTFVFFKHEDEAAGPRMARTFAALL